MDLFALHNFAINLVKEETKNDNFYLEQNQIVMLTISFMLLPASKQQNSGSSPITKMLSYLLRTSKFIFVFYDKN